MERPDGFFDVSHGGLVFVDMKLAYLAKRFILMLIDELPKGGLDQGP